MARTPFKLKSSPTKGKLDDFFKGLGRKGTEARLTEQVQENQGMTKLIKLPKEKVVESLSFKELMMKERQTKLLQRQVTLPTLLIKKQEKNNFTYLRLK